MKLRYMVDCVLRHDEKGQPWYEPLGVWVQGPGPGLDIEMFYVESNNPAVLARKDEANWMLNRLVEDDITSMPADFLKYHRLTLSAYSGTYGLDTTTVHQLHIKDTTLLEPRILAFSICLPFQWRWLHSLHWSS